MVNNGVTPAAEGKVITSTDRNGNTEVARAKESASRKHPGRAA